MQHKHNKIFELTGDTCNIAIELHELMQEKLLNDIDLTSSHDDVADFTDHYRPLLEQIGYFSRALQVRISDMTHVRAYEHTPFCVFHPDGRHRVLMVVPVDYLGRHFVPANAVEMTGQDREDIESKAIENLSPVWLAKLPYGVPTPADFDPAIHLADICPDHRVSLAINRAIAGIVNLTHIFCDGSFVYSDQSPDKIALQISIGHSAEQGQMTLEMGAIDTVTNEIISLRSSPAFTAQATDSSLYRIIPNPLTAGGRVVQDILDKVTSVIPTIAQAWQAADDIDRVLEIAPPPPPVALLHLRPDAPWPFPKSCTANPMEYRP